MKKHFKILTAAAMVCLLAGVLIYSGCKKALLEKKQGESQIALLNGSIPCDLFTGVSVQGGMLRFENLNLFLCILQKLETEDDKYIQGIEKQLINMIDMQSVGDIELNQQAKDTLNELRANLIEVEGKATLQLKIKKQNGVISIVQDVITGDLNERQQALWNNLKGQVFDIVKVDSRGEVEYELEIEAEIEDEYLDNLNWDYVMENFENHFSFYSLRKKIREEEEVWLDNEELDTINDPDNHYIDDVYLRTVLNLGAEVMIGSSIFKITDEGTNWEITDGDVSALEMIRNGYYDEAEALRNVIAHYRGQALHSACKTWKADVTYKRYASNKKMYKKYICVRNYMWAHYVKAKTKSYKKKGNRWKNYYTTVKARVYGKIWGPGYLGEVCSWQHNFGGPYKSRYHRWVKSKQPFGARTWAKTGTVISWNKASYSSSYFSMTW